jgi:cytochrome oxidase Cu insertion factor (SCO1/SenC/PrrC family)
MNQPPAVRPGAASFALLMILVISASWWALALWPAGGVEPLWLLRTRAACFGSAPGGLPDAGGWILLIGEPLGMVGVLVAVWGVALRDDLRRIRQVPLWRGLAAVTVAGLVVGLAAVGRRVAFATGLGATPMVPDGMPTRINADVSGIELTDQHGRRTSLADFRGRPVLLTFAFGHCTTVCPAIVHDLRAARAEANRGDVPLVIISIDPWRDTPGQLPAVAAAWKLDAEDRVLSGSVAEVEQALDRLGVGRRRDRNTGDVDHAGTVMGLDRQGHVVWRLDGGWGRAKVLVAAL